MPSNDTYLSTYGKCVATRNWHLATEMQEVAEPGVDGSIPVKLAPPKSIALALRSKIAADLNLFSVKCYRSLFGPGFRTRHVGTPKPRNLSSD